MIPFKEKTNGMIKNTAVLLIILCMSEGYLSLLQDAPRKLETIPTDFTNVHRFASQKSTVRMSRNMNQEILEVSPYIRDVRADSRQSRIDARDIRTDFREIRTELRNVPEEIDRRSSPKQVHLINSELRDNRVQRTEKGNNSRREIMRQVTRRTERLSNEVKERTQRSNDNRQLSDRNCVNWSSQLHYSRQYFSRLSRSERNPQTQNDSDNQDRRKIERSTDKNTMIRINEQETKFSGRRFIIENRSRLNNRQTLKDNTQRLLNNLNRFHRERNILKQETQRFDRKRNEASNRVTMSNIHTREDRIQRVRNKPVKFRQQTIEFSDREQVAEINAIKERTKRNYNTDRVNNYNNRIYRQNGQNTERQTSIKNEIMENRIQQNNIHNPQIPTKDEHRFNLRSSINSERHQINKHMITPLQYRARFTEKEIKEKHTQVKNALPIVDRARKAIEERTRKSQEVNRRSIRYVNVHRRRNERSSKIENMRRRNQQNMHRLNSRNTKDIDRERSTDRNFDQYIRHNLNSRIMFANNLEHSADRQTVSKSTQTFERNINREKPQSISSNARGNIDRIIPAYSTDRQVKMTRRIQTCANISGRRNNLLGISEQPVNRDFKTDRTRQITSQERREYQERMKKPLVLDSLAVNTAGDIKELSKLEGNYLTNIVQTLLMILLLGQIMRNGSKTKLKLPNWGFRFSKEKVL